MINKSLIPYLLLVIILSGCEKTYSQVQVNATMAAVIKEVASIQKVVTLVQTVLVETVITATPERTNTLIPYFPTVTPQGFDRFTKERTYQSLRESGIELTRYFEELDHAESYGLSALAVSSTKFDMIHQGASYTCKLFVFANAAAMKQAETALRQETATWNGGVENILIRSNLILLMNPTLSDIEKDALRLAFSEIRN